jgi:hypothetical protein
MLHKLNRDKLSLVPLSPFVDSQSWCASRSGVSASLVDSTDENIAMINLLG